MTDEQREWRPIPGCPGYWASNDGLVGSNKVRIDCFNRPLRSAKIQVLRPGRESRTRKYLKVVLRNNGRSLTRKVHQLVLEAFVGTRPPGGVCRHLNGDPLDNRIENICWGTVRENVQDAIRHGTRRQARREVI